MSAKILLRPVSSNRRQPLLRQSQSRNSGRIFGEVVGGTAAECVAVCCCCPCGLANFLILAVYKVPLGLCRRVLKRRKRQQLLKDGLLMPRRRHCSCGSCDENGIQIRPMCANDASDFKSMSATRVRELDTEVMELEKEMWERFYNTGFWRSSSKRDSTSHSQRIPIPSNVSNRIEPAGEEKLALGPL